MTATALRFPLQPIHIEDFCHEFFSQTSVVAWINSPGGVVLAVSDNYENNTGISAPTNSHISELFPPDALQRVTELNTEALANGHSEATLAVCGKVWRSWQFLIQHGGRTLVLGMAAPIC